MITAILQFFGRILLWIYNFCGNYALSLAIFTLLTKLVLFPLSYKGKQNMMQMNSMNAEMQRLQKQYGKDQQRYQQELQKLYEEEQVNPMGGCLWSLLPLPIMMGLYYVIRKPMLYMLCLTEDQISTVKEALVAAQSGILDGVSQAYEEIRIMSVISQDSSLYQVAANALGDAADKLQTINFNFLGVNLGAIPDWKFWGWDSVTWNNIGLFLIPIAVTVLNFLYSQYSMKSSQIKNGDEKKEEAAAAANQSTKTMMMVMPLMYLWFGYIMPAGMCIYMACNAVFSALQELIFSKFLNKKFAAEEEERKKRLAERREQEKAKKAEIAARRAAEQEELAKKGKKAVKQAQKKQLDSGAGAIGVRRYARGRAFEADRYPTTPYRDPQDVLDEEALERALAKRGKKQAAEELPTETSAETVSNANDDNEE
ncbi:MAG: YidC/Oxa1 family membrane protein insertase [Candidatus Onthomonas sp.]|nr:YidC/Oxa1 family membrane protein insertase [Candidatus Onthomonas sp.]